MPQSLSNVLIHMVFSTKNRQPFLRDIEIRRQLHAQLGAISKNLNCTPVIINGMDDHVHILGNLARTITLSDWVKELKRVSSIWIKQHDPNQDQFKWQAGYGAFSVSESQRKNVISYIRNQEEHHKKIDFQSELRALLERHGVTYDEKYLWD